MLLVHVRSADEVGDELRQKRSVARQHPAVEGRLVARGPGVHVAADILDRFGQLARAASAGALEHHMLDEVGEPGAMLGLRARADHRVEAHRDALRARKRVDRDGEAVAEAVHRGAHAFCSFFQRSSKREPVDQCGNAREQEPLDRVGPVVVRDGIERRRSDRLEPRRSARGDEAHPSVVVRRDDAADQPAGPVHLRVGILRPADGDAHSRAFRAGRAVDDMDVARLSR